MKEKGFILLAFLIAGLFLVPPGYVSYLSKGENIAVKSSVSGDFLEGKAVSTVSWLKITPVSPQEVPSYVYNNIEKNMKAKIDAPVYPTLFNKDIKPVPMRGDDILELRDKRLVTNRGVFSEPINSLPIDGNVMKTFSLPQTRSTVNEQEPNDSPENGTYISTNTEKNDVYGSFGTTTQGTDNIDFYKIELDAQSRPAGIITNLTLHLKSWQKTGVQNLIEPHPNSWHSNADIEFDVIYIDVWHPYIIFDNYAGTDWYFDDLDDSNNDDQNHTFREGWNLSMEAPHQSFGQESAWNADPSLEFGWYYIGLQTLSIRAGQSSSSIPRQSYVLEVDPTVKVNGDMEAQDFYNSTAMPQNSGTLHLNNFYDHWDCFNITGSDPNAIWDVNVTFDITDMYWYPVYISGQLVAFYYTWVYIYAYFIDYERNIRWYSLFSSDSHMLLSTPNPVYIEMTHNYTKSNRTALFIGFHARPIYALHQSDGWHVYAESVGDLPLNYTLSYSINEIAPNNKPVIAGADIKAIDPEKDRRWGNLQDTYRVNVTYVDQDNDPPEVLKAIFDYNTTPKEFDILSDGQALYKTDNDYTDGKEYYIDITGAELGVEPLQDSTFHKFKIIAKDHVTNTKLRSKWADEYFCPYKVQVWDDQPPKVNSNAPYLLGPYDEDSSPPDYMLSNIFSDPDGFDTLDIFVWNDTMGNWSKKETNDVFTAQVVMGAGQLVLRLTLLPNAYGTETIKLMARDPHYNVTKSLDVQVTPVNDPPEIKSLSILDPQTHEIKDTVTVRDNEVNIDATQDQTMKFQINAEDIEGDSLSYYMDIRKTTIPDVDVGDTGEVTFTPTNDDVGEQTIVVDVDDGGAGGKVELTINVNVINVNDPPKIMPNPIGLNNPYTQGDRIDITVRATDPDVSDKNRLTYSTDFQEVVDQIMGSGVLQKSVDWDINTQTGEFWFDTSKQEIFGTKDQVLIKANFTVTDPSSASDSIQITFTLLNRNDPPESPTDFIVTIADGDLETPGNQNLTAKFTAPEVTDPDGDKITYIWDFGDGSRIQTQDRNINHTFPDTGEDYTPRTYQVTLLVSDGELTSDTPVIKTITIQKPTPPPPPQKPNPSPNNGTNSMVMMVGIIGIVLAIVVLAVVLMIRKKKPAVAPTAPAQGVLPGRPSPQLPPGTPPAGVGVPQAHSIGGAAPAAPPQAPQPEMGAGELRCPYCGAPIEPGWVICPNCKNPLV